MNPSPDHPREKTRFALRRRAIHNSEPLIFNWQPSRTAELGRNE